MTSTPPTPPGRRFPGSAVIVTGAGSGIGLETARRFAAEGATVALLEMRTSALQAAVDLIEGEGGSVLPFEADVTAPAQVTAAVDAAVDQLGGLDVLANIAGFGAPSPFDETTDEYFTQMLATNVGSVHAVSSRAWPHLVARGGGVIVNTASIAGTWAIAGLSAYGAAKAAVIALTRTMAFEGGSKGIRVNCVTPGHTLSPTFQAMIDSAPAPDALHAMFAGQSPLGRMARPGDVAEAFLYLASDAASFVTGANLVVDGGITLGEAPISGRSTIVTHEQLR